MVYVCLGRLSFFLIYVVHVVQSDVPDTFLVDKNITTDQMPFGKLVMNTRLNHQHFNELTGGSLMNCVTECLVRQHCKSFSYNKNNRVCLIYDVHHNSSLTDPAYVYSEIRTWPKVMLIYLYMYCELF